MRIIFNLYGCGLGNQGGSMTIVRSANTLHKLGHEVYIIDSMRNMHTWTPLEAKHMIIKNISQIPNADVVIATGFKTVQHTLSLPDRCGVKTHWIRGWETWTMPEQRIINQVLKNKVIKIVNSIGLQAKLKSHGFDSHVIYPGYDFDQLFPMNLRGKSDKVIIGGLNKRGKHEVSKRTSWIDDTVKMLKKKYGKKIELWMFGADKLPDHTMVDKYVRSPSIEEKNFIYNNVDIWLSTSMNEGNHLPPAESLITECCVIGTNAEMSGTKDYLIHGVTGIITKNDIVSFQKGVIELIENKNKRIEYGKSGFKRIIEIGDREKNMKKMIELFESLR